jgi:LmbE family N-acetylglucosaminyl deacetylase
MDITKNTILIIAAHPDDDAFGCGGTIAKLSKNKNNIYAIYFTDGVSARLNQKDLKKNIIQRRLNTNTAAKILGIKNYSYCLYPDNKLDSIPLLEIVQRIEQEIKVIKPDIIFTHFGNDLNIDHRIINKAVITATRPKPKNKVKKILLFETLSNTEWNFSGSKTSFNPNYFVDISKTIDKKIKAAKSYNKEIFSWPHPRSVKGIKILAMFRGQSVGLKLAEGFQLLRAND